MRTRFVSIAITAIILGVLIFSGPANAFVLSLSIINPVVYSGEIISFVMSADTENNENGIDYLTLDLTGSLIYSCKFDANGTIISGCLGMNITIISDDYGYSYGYGYNILNNIIFQIDLNTSDYRAGVYKTLLTVVQGDSSSDKRGKVINIKKTRKGIIDCSVRGSGGTLEVENADLGKNNKVNFYLPLNNAASGKGYLTGQSRNERFSYNFDVLEVLNNSDSEARMFVSGNYRLGLSPEVKEDAVIVLNKSGMINLMSNNINLDEMKITFMKGC
ncbi:MAG: hypothetical protein ABH840_00200 [Nanoarchaeota archaeon]